MIDGVTNASGVAVLERLLQFAGQRHRLIANNIANFDTPGFRPVDVSVEGFQRQLGEAIDAGRSQDGRAGDRLALRDSAEVTFGPDSTTLHPRPAQQNILFHDGNDRDLERTMQSMVENFMTFRFAAQMLKNRFELINTAIRERV